MDDGRRGFPQNREPHSPGDRHSLWYKDAIVYELHVRTFHDSDGDGIGDFAGLTEKLDYLQDLGVTAIWLLPFYPRRSATMTTTLRITWTSIRIAAPSTMSPDIFKQLWIF
jgi:pullulanase/glycogen debranching enzyme